MKRTDQLVAAALGLALASILTTRVLRAFSVAEAMAVGAFIAGTLLLLAHRYQTVKPRMQWPYRLIVGGSVIGLGGLLLKAVFVLLGIGAATHDMADHGSTPGNPLLLHIHHLFFNIGFVLFLVAAIGLLARRIRSRASH
ncbi:MAG: hypothetical protein KJ040_02365 [Gammaproteobacteria bacterium]|nr:hypothetical protein [Gammaproteobacteria bacterium]